MTAVPNARSAWANMKAGRTVAPTNRPALSTNLPDDTKEVSTCG